MKTDITEIALIEKLHDDDLTDEERADFEEAEAELDRNEAIDFDEFISEYCESDDDIEFLPFKYLVEGDEISVAIAT